MPRSFILVVILFVIVLAVSSVAGCYYYTRDSRVVSTNSFHSFYDVNVTGLANYTGDGSFRVLVPMPMWNGTPEYTAEQVSSGRFNFPDYNLTTYWDVNTGWSAVPVNTEHGQMIALTPKNSSNLSDFVYTINADKDVSDSDVEQLNSEVLSASIMFPNASTNVRSNYSRDNAWYNNWYNNCSSYTSYISIGHGLAPAQTSADSDNISIMVSNDLDVSEGWSYRVYSDNYLNVSIPQGASGWIPVTVLNSTNTINSRPTQGF